MGAAAYGSATNGGKNSFFKKPFGTGQGSMAQMMGMENPELAMGGLSKSDLKNEKAYLKQVKNQMAGKGKSLAVEQYRKAQGDNLAGAMSMAQSNQGVSNPALLSRNVAMAQDNQGQELAQESAMLRLQEKQAAMGMMSNHLAGKQNLAMGQANMINQGNQATMGRQMQVVGGIGQAAVMASDKNLKEDIKPSEGKAHEKVEDFLNALESYTFEYKNKKHGEGEKVGVMAQDLEKSELGKGMVENTPQGKVVNFGEGFAAILAAQAELKKEIDSLKGKKA